MSSPNLDEVSLPAAGRGGDWLCLQVRGFQARSLRNAREHFRADLN